MKLTTGGRTAEIALLFAGSMCVVPFLVSYHELPMANFYPEWLAAALGLLAAATLIPSGGPVARLPAAARWLSCFAVLLPLEAAVRGSAYPQMAWWGSAYVIYAVLMLWLGAQLRCAAGFDRTATLIASCIFVGALANAVIGIAQFHGRPDWIESVVADFRGGRVHGNIAQANLYANYLALGQAALLFLWATKRVHVAFATTALVLLCWASALSLSRAALLYAVWIALAAALAAGRRPNVETRRLCWGAAALAAAVMLAHTIVPLLNGLAGNEAPGLTTLERAWTGSPDLRWPLWGIAWRIFLAAPLLGVGLGEFAGAAFSAGLPAEMTAAFAIWTSPHNLVLQLLAETGVVGAILVLGAWGVWWWQSGRLIRADPNPALWFIVAVVGVELLHSMVEFPMWNAHFLGITALCMGTGSSASYARPAAWKAFCGAMACAALLALLAATLLDYWKLDLTRATGTGTTLPVAGASEDAATLSRLGSGLLAPVAELWILRGVAIDRDRLDAKLRLSERVIHYWPSPLIAVRLAIFLALAGRVEEAASVVDKIPEMSPGEHRLALSLLARARDAAPTALGPLIHRFQQSQGANAVP
jgi:O-antigen ligase